MIHTVELVLPANTPVTAPESVTAKLGACIVERVAVEFPRGCYWLAHVRVLLREHQLYPTTPGDWLESEGQMLVWSDNTAVIDSPYELRVEGYNTDERYSHTIRLYLDITELTQPGLVTLPATLESGYLG